MHRVEVRVMYAGNVTKSFIVLEYAILVLILLLALHAVFPHRSPNPITFVPLRCAVPLHFSTLARRGGMSGCLCPKPTGEKSTGSGWLAAYSWVYDALRGNRIVMGDG